MRLADLIDLEWLLRDGEPDVGDPRSLREMLQKRGVAEPEVRRRLDGERGLRVAVCTEWLRVMRQQHTRLPGARFERAEWVVGWILILAGLLIGGATARVLLAYDGSTPVNVTYFVFVAVVLQIVLLLVTIWVVLFARRSKASGGYGVAQRTVGWLFGKLLGKQREEVVDGLTELRNRRELYARAERWTLFRLTQRFGVAFNVGVLMVTLVMFSFSDFKFRWSSTVGWAAEEVHVVVEVLAEPWGWAVPAARPSFEVIEASEWDRMQRDYLSKPEDGDDLPKRWWPFLLMGVLVYGLLPRLLAMGFGGWRLRCAIGRAGLDHAGFQRLYDRLFPSSVGWAGPDPSQVRGDDPALGGGRLGAGRVSVPRGAPTWVVAWGRLAGRRAEVAALVERRFGAELRAELAAGGRDLQDDRRSLDRLKADRAGRVVLVCEAGQQPSKDVLGFLSDIRAAIGAERPLVVSLIEERDGDGFGDAEPDEYEAWRRALVALGDAHLWLEGLEGVE